MRIANFFGQGIDKRGVNVLSLQPNSSGSSSRDRYMKENKEVKISYVAAHLTTIISVTLVLVLVGIIAMVWIGAGKETRRLRERIELSVVMADSVSDASAQQLAGKIRQQPYALKVTFVSRLQALKNWTADTGEDLEALFGVNPLSPEIDFTVKADYSDAASIARICKQLSTEPGVDTVSAPDNGVVDSVNRSLSGLTALLGAIAVVMLVISFVLINNTVHLTIYSRRFTIHTMQLVGATNGYIRRPVVLNNMMCGLVAGLIASMLLAIVLIFAPQAGFASADRWLGWPEFSAVAVGIILVGMAVCALAAWIATGKYLRKDYDELFR